MRNYPAIIIAVMAGAILSIVAGFALASYATAGTLPLATPRAKPPRVVDPYHGGEAFADGWQGQASGSSRL